MTTKVEYCGVVNVGTKAIWIRQLLGELSFLVDEAIVIYCDHQSTIQVANNLVAHSKMEHAELHVHYLQHFIHESIVKLVYCCIDD